MSTMRAHIVLPAKLAKEIDELVNPRGRSAFLVENAEREVKSRKLLAFLERHEAAWSDEDHPEIAEHGSDVRVHNLRRERSERQERLEPLADRESSIDLKAQ